MKDAIRKLFSKINGAIVKHADEACYPYSTFGAFAIVTYLLFYFIWKFISPTGYENLNLRLLAVFLAKQEGLAKKQRMSIAAVLVFNSNL